MAGLTAALGSCSQVIWSLQPPCLPLPTRGSRNSLSALCQRECWEDGCWDCWINSAVYIIPIYPGPSLEPYFPSFDLGPYQPSLVILELIPHHSSCFQSLCLLGPRHPTAASRFSKTHLMALLPCFTILSDSPLPSWGKGKVLS